MPINPDIYSAFRSRESLLDDQWRDFFDVRSQDWLPLVRREMPLDLQKVLGNTFRFPIQVPHLRRAGNEHVAILTMNQNKASLIPLESGKDAKEDIGQIETWLTAKLNRMNKGRWYDHWKSECQTYYGVGAVRFMYELPKEPDDDDLAPYMERYSAERGPEDPGNAYASSLGDKEKARHDYYRDKTDECFWLKPVDPLTLKWGPDLNDPAVFQEKAEISYAEFKKLRTGDGKGLSVDELGKVYILGAGENEEHTRQDQVEGRKFSFIHENVRDPETGRWHCYEYVMGTDAEAGQGSEYGALVADYEIPFEYPEYVICPSGNENLTEQDPHKRYTPILYELMVFCHELNYLLTIQMELALMAAAGQFDYVNLGRADPNLIQAFETAGWQVEEGAGAGQKRARIPRERAGNREDIPAYPGAVEPFPNALQDYLILRIQHLQDVDIPGALPNRFLTGSAPSSETAQAPASSLALQTQAAQLNADQHLSKQDTAGEGVAWRIFGYIRGMDQGVSPDEQKEYPIAASGEEGPGVKAGEEIVVTAHKLRRSFDVAMFTKRETLQEELQIWARADVDLERNLIDLEEYYEIRGYTDPLEQIRKMNRERHRTETAAQFAGVEMQERQRLYTLLTGLIPPPMGMEQGAEGQPGQAQPQGEGTTVPQPAPRVAPPPVGGMETSGRAFGG